MRKIILCAVLLTVTACAMQQNPAKTRIYTPMGKIEYKCPPGQAKKGRC